MPDPKHPRKLSEEFKRQIVQLYDNGKSPAGIRAEYPAAVAAEEGFLRSSGRYGARRMKRALAKRGIAASRRRIGAMMKSRNLASRCAKAKFRPHPDSPNEADLPNVLGREFDGHAPCTHIVGDLTYMRVLGA